MNTQTYLTTARLSAAGMLALMITACGSSGSSGTTTPASSVAASSSVPASSVTAVSSEAVTSSSAAPAAIAESCNVADGTYLACLDLEGMAPGAVPSGFNLGGNGAVEVVEGEGSHSGTLALKVDSSKGVDFLTMDDFSGTHWGRLYYKNLTHPSPVLDWSHTTLVAAYSEATGTQYRLVDMVAAPDSDASKIGKYQHLYNIDNANEIDQALEGPYDHSYNDEWVCLEWQVDAVNQEYNVFFNGDKLALANGGVPSNATDFKQGLKWDGSRHDFDPVPTTFDQIKIGIQNYKGFEYSFLLDDIAISATERVGCEIAEAAASSEMMSSSSMMSSAAMSSSSVASSVAMSSLAASSVAMSSLAPSSVAMSSLAPSSVAMSSVAASSVAMSSSAPSGPTQAEIDVRVAAGKALYDGGSLNACAGCHGADGTSILFDPITDTTRDYAGLVEVVRDGVAGTTMPACKPAGDCAEQITDYMWVTFLGNTLTADGGE